MRCPYCGSAQNKVVDSREAGDAIRRRRQCESCGERFTTYERVDALRMYVAKPVAGPDQLAMEDLQDGPVPSAQKSILATPQSGPKTTRRAARNTERRGHASHP